MATIKSLLSAALDSHLKSEKEWVGKQGFRYKSFIEILPYPGTTGKIDVNYVPPCDGWAIADDDGSDSDLYIQGAFLVYSGKTSGSCRRSIYAPVIKGGVCHISGKASGTAYIMFAPLESQG